MEENKEVYETKQQVGVALGEGYDNIIMLLKRLSEFIPDDNAVCNGEELQRIIADEIIDLEIRKNIFKQK